MSLVCSGGGAVGGEIVAGTNAVAHDNIQVDPCTAFRLGNHSPTIHSTFQLRQSRGQVDGVQAGNDVARFRRDSRGIPLSPRERSFGIRWHAVLTATR